jgi:hypothetical protein
MKKVLFLLVLCVAVVFANAQEKKIVDKKDIKTTTVVKTEKPVMRPTMIKEADLLPAITENIKKDYADCKFMRAIKNEVKGLVTYEIHLRKDANLIVLAYDKDGKFLKKEEKKIEPRKMEVKKVEGTKEMKEVKKEDTKVLQLKK